MSLPSIHTLGLDALLVRFADAMSDDANRSALSFRAALEADPPQGVVETAPTLVSVLVRFDPLVVGHEALRDTLLDRARDDARTTTGQRRRWHIPMSVDTAAKPLAEIADTAGMTSEQVIAMLTDADIRVLTLGFAPGQPYLGLLPSALDVPRAPDLRPVKAGAVVLAVRQLVLFANDSPTGWREVGQTAFRCFRPEDTQPVPLQPGDAVRFHVVAESRIEALRQDNADGAELEVLE